MMGSKIWRLGLGLAAVFCGWGPAWAADPPSSARLEQCEKYRLAIRSTAASSDQKAVGVKGIAKGEMSGRESSAQEHQAASQGIVDTSALRYKVCVEYYGEQLWTEQEYKNLARALSIGTAAYRAELKKMQEQTAADAEAERTKEVVVEAAKEEAEAKAAREREEEMRANKDAEAEADREEAERRRRDRDEIAAAEKAARLRKINSSGGGKSWKLLGGGVVALAGGGLVGTTTLTAYTDGKGPNGPQDDWKQLQLLNSVGWGLVFVGGATAGTAFLSPDGIVIGGRF